MSSKSNYFVVILLILLFNKSVFAQGQNSDSNAGSHKIKIVSNGRNPYNSPWNFYSTTAESTRRNSGRRFTSASFVCVYGIWALYDQIDFGEDSETTTGVVVLRSSESNGGCTSSAKVTRLQQIKSYNFLGHATVASQGLVIYSEANFLGVSYRLTSIPSSPTAITPVSGIHLGSLAITGATGRWRLCSDPLCENTVICIDMRGQLGGLYYNENVQQDRSGLWPLFIRAVSTADEGECQSQSVVTTSVPYTLELL